MELFRILPMMSLTGEGGRMQAAKLHGLYQHARASASPGKVKWAHDLSRTTSAHSAGTHPVARKPARPFRVGSGRTATAPVSQMATGDRSPLLEGSQETPEGEAR